MDVTGEFPFLASKAPPYCDKSDDFRREEIQMNTPGFTAEAALGKMKENYALNLGHATENGRVVPQFCFGNTCCTCFDEGGFSGCFCHRRPVLSVGFGSPVER